MQQLVDLIRSLWHNSEALLFPFEDCVVSKLDGRLESYGVLEHVKFNAENKCLLV